jgi:outer membrane lipoprotein-sorting protein
MKTIRFTALSLAVAALAPTAFAGGVDTSIKSYICAKLDDFEADVTVAQSNQRELGKIGKDFGMVYRFKQITMRYKEPNKARMDVSAEGAKGIFIVNGSRQWVSVPKLGIKSSSDFGKSPGKRKSLIDVGLISEYYLTYANAKFEREGTVDGTPVAVFDLTYKDREEDSSHARVYIDPKTKVMLKRESYSQDGKLQAVYLFKNVVEVKPGIWVPTRIEAHNVDRVLAGALEYKNIKVNTGLSDSLFTL